MDEIRAKRWLVWGIGFTEVSGFLMVVGSLIPGAFDDMATMLFSAERAIAVDVPARLALGIAGAVLTGWGVVMGYLVRTLERLSPAVVGSAFCWGAGSWFVLDGVVSVALGAYANLIGNLLYFALLFFPARVLAASGHGEHRSAQPAVNEKAI